jgi:hypothetical protein
LILDLRLDLLSSCFYRSSPLHIDTDVLISPIDHFMVICWTLINLSDLIYICSGTFIMELGGLLVHIDPQTPSLSNGVKN